MPHSYPLLAPPGAGLPIPELWIARALMALRCAAGSRESFTARFKAEHAAIVRLLNGCDARMGAQPALIKRLRGLEDSSRYWSVWMTLDHLRIVNEAIRGVLDALSHGNPLSGAASTAAVKPSPDATEAIIGPYEESCTRLLETAASVPDLKTSLRYSHPWFGPMNAFGWYALAGAHMGIHRRQIALIRQQVG